MNEFKAEEFAKLLTDGFQDSSIKTITDLAAAVNSNKGTISRLMSAAPQTVTGKPSQPKSELVVRLAETLKLDMDKTLMLAGYAPLGKAGDERTDDELVANGFFSEYYELPEDKRRQARKAIAAVIRSFKDEDFED